MALSLKQLITPVTEEEALASILDTLDDLGFQATAWQSGSVQRTIAQLFARVYSDLTETVVDVAKSGFATLATSTYADYLGTYAYNLTRIPATATLGQMVLTSSPAAPIHTWSAGELLIADAPEGEEANTYEVLASGTLNPGTSVTVNVRAAVPGSAANIAPNVSTLTLWTPLVGVTVTNPPVTGSSTWITTPGTDAETDARYTARMIGRWDRLTYGNTEGAYRAWCLEALPALSRLVVLTEAAGVVSIVGATSTGGIDATQIQTILDYLNGVSDGVGRRPINDNVIIVSATAKTLPDVIATVSVKGPFATADIEEDITNALIAYFGSLPIGGIKLPGDTVGKVLIAEMFSAVMAIEGVVNVSFASASDVVLDATEIYTPSITVTTVIVP